MKTKGYSPAETLMRARLAESFRKEDQKQGNLWKHQGGRLERVAKMIYFVFAVYMLMVCLINQLIISASQGAVNAQRAQFFLTNRYLVYGVLLCTVGALFVALFKKMGIAFVVQSLASVLYLLQVVQIYRGEYTNQHLLAGMYLAGLVAFFALLTIVVVRGLDAGRLSRAVAVEYQKLYERYQDDEQGMFTPEGLEQVALAYETALAKGETPPKTISC